MREPKVFLVIGGRGSGKTTFLEQRLSKQKTVVIELYKTARWDGFKKFFFDDVVNGKVSLKSLANSAIVFEDATSCISPNMKNSLRQLIVYSKQLGSDVYVVFHSVNVVPAFLWNMWNYLVLMKKTPKPKLKSYYEDDFPAITSAWNKLNKLPDYSYLEIQSNF